MGKSPASTAEIIDAYELFFDPDDQSNGSLYICVARGAPQPDSIIEALVAENLWSARESTKQVADEQRQAYKEGLVFKAARTYRGALGEFLIARFDHPKFPSDAARFNAWRDVLDQLADQQA
ncbi:MAG: hypothetical protein AAF384_02290 [Pseudomonadota bacterium]